MLKLEITSPVSHENRLSNALYVPQGRDFDVSDVLAGAMARMTGTAMSQFGVQLDERGVATAGFNQFGLSPLTDRTVQSAPFNNCLCLAAVGQNVSTQDSASQLGVFGHFTPGEAFDSQISADIEALVLERMQLLRQQTIEGTRALIVAGGGMDITDPETLTDSTEVYLHTLGLFERAAEVFGIEPQVLQPVFGSHHRYATLHTQERRLVVMPVHRPQMFLPPQVLPVLGRAVEVRQALQTLLSRALPPEKSGS